MERVYENEKYSLESINAIKSKQFPGLIKRLGWQEASINVRSAKPVVAYKLNLHVLSLPFPLPLSFSLSAPFYSSLLFDAHLRMSRMSHLAISPSRTKRRKIRTRFKFRKFLARDTNFSWLKQFIPIIYHRFPSFSRPKIKSFIHDAKRQKTELCS